MRFACLALLLLLAACGSERTPNQPEPVRANADSKPQPSSNKPDEPAGTDWDAIPEPVVDTKRSWLRVEGRGEGEVYTWRVNGNATDTDSMERVLQEYADKIDHGAELKGRDEDGISPNPVVYAAGPEVSSQAFFALLELIVSASIYRFIVELDVPGQSPRRIWQKLPFDQGLTADRDGDAIPDAGEFARAQNDYKFYVRIRRDGRSYDYLSSTTSKDRKVVEGAGFQMTELMTDGWNEELYRKKRESLARSLLTSQGTGPEARDVFEITPMGDILTDKLYAEWAPVFLAMDAADLANNAPDRGDRPHLFTSFRFTDALDRYK